MLLALDAIALVPVKAVGMQSHDVMHGMQLYRQLSSSMAKGNVPLQPGANIESWAAKAAIESDRGGEFDGPGSSAVWVLYVPVDSPERKSPEAGSENDAWRWDRVSGRRRHRPERCEGRHLIAILGLTCETLKGLISGHPAFVPKLTLCGTIGTRALASGGPGSGPSVNSSSPTSAAQ